MDCTPRQHRPGWSRTLEHGQLGYPRGVQLAVRDIRLEGDGTDLWIKMSTMLGAWDSGGELEGQMERRTYGRGQATCARSCYLTHNSSALFHMSARGETHWQCFGRLLEPTTVDPSEVGPRV